MASTEKTYKVLVKCLLDGSSSCRRSRRTLGNNFLTMRATEERTHREQTEVEGPLISPRGGGGE
jgi:hypothetical protein